MSRNVFRAELREFATGHNDSPVRNVLPIDLVAT